MNPRTLPGTLIWALACVAAMASSVEAQMPSDTIVRQSALDGCVRINHLWKAQLAIETRTRGDSVRRADALVREVFHPHRAFWDPLVGASEAQFLKATDSRTMPFARDVLREIPFARDPGSLVIEASQRLAALTRRPVPCAEWYVVFGIGAGPHHLGSGLTVDLRWLQFHAAGDPMGDLLSELVVRRIYRESRRADPDSGRIIDALLEEGIVAHVSALDRGRGTSIREALGYEENVLHWAAKNEALLWDAVRPRLRDRGIPQFDFRGTQGMPGVGRQDRLLGYRIVEQYLARHGGESWRDFFAKPAMRLLDESGFETRLAADSATFRITTNEFWLNLHHFLHVLGRAKNGEPDAARDAVAQAPVDAERALARLDSADRATWDAAVATYADKVSKRDLVFDQRLPLMANALVGADVTTHLPYSGPELEVAEALRRAAPIYREAWWPEHEVANRRWADSLRTMVERHGDEVLAFIRRAYRMPWPTSGYPVRVVAYANWAGAYSTRGQLLVISSMAPSLQGLHGLETSFHEAMHQWDDSVLTLIGTHANRLGVRAPVGLSHQMIFFTAGEAVRHAVPSHVPYAERFGVWNRIGPAARPVLEELWSPYLAGRGDRNAVIGEIVRRLGTPR